MDSNCKAHPKGLDSRAPEQRATAPVMKVEEEKAGVGKLDPANYRRRHQDQEDCRSIHIGLSVPSYPQRKRDQQRRLSGLQKVCWGLQPDKPQQELTGTGSRGNSRDGNVDHARRTSEF
uniref:Solute carrier family 4 member 5 n=2 Tax=Suricata suricatta TaxID=37032 RepID=A0A673T0S1_SURSU